MTGNLQTQVACFAYDNTNYGLFPVCPIWAGYAQVTTEKEGLLTRTAYR